VLRLPLPFSLRRPPLRLVLVVPFILQSALAVGITSWLSMRNGRNAVNDLADQLRHQVSSQISDKLTTYLEPAMLVNRLNANTIVSGGLQVNKLADLEPYLTQQLNGFKALNGVAIGQQKPDYIGLGYDDNDRTSLYLSYWHPTQGGTYDWQINAQGERVLLGKDASYDHRTRSWYQAAILARQPTWSEIDLSITPQNLILSANHPIYDKQGQLWGVASTDLGLGQISQFLQSLPIGKTGEAFIIERNGLLVATSTPELPYQVNADASELTRIAAEQSQYPLVRSAIANLRSHFKTLAHIHREQHFTLEIDGQRYLGEVIPFYDNRGIDWLIITIVPESDFMAAIHTNTRTTIFLCLATLLLTLIASSLLTSTLVKPITSVIHRAEALSKGNWSKGNWSKDNLQDNNLHEPTTKELFLLLQTFDRMAQQLQNSFSRLEYSAYHDPLTGLLNQTAFRLKLKHMLELYSNVAIHQALPSVQPPKFTVLLIDLDDFKLINDSLGHQVGDDLLKDVAIALRECLSASDILARFSGDEFVILLAPTLEHSRDITLAQTILQRFQYPFQVTENTLFLSVSIGIASYAQSGEQPQWPSKAEETVVPAIPSALSSLDQAEKLLRNADIALYRAKSNAKAHYEVFSHQMHVQAVARLQLATDLRYAIERNELTLYYQPIVDLTNHQISGFEALIRWQHPQQGLISPTAFLPIAEETGIILELGQWVLEQACLQMQHWQQQFSHCAAMTISVNVASKQFWQTDLLSQIQTVLRTTGINPQSLKLEITETSLLKNQDMVLGVLRYIQALGVKIALDDFGMGYSSLSYLHQFPIDILKIDRFFVQALGANDQSGQVAEIICQLAQKLNLLTIAEGIETSEQLARVKQMNCNYVQGYYFWQPLSAIEVYRQFEKMQGI
jgi:diguanylate cyclase (GGDEF)-like protein